MEIPHSRSLSLDFFEKYVATQALNLKNSEVYDLSAGSGYIINLFKEQGANVHLFDLLPNNNQFCEIACKPINLQENFPIGNQVADVVICAETIEHLPNQHLFFKEVSRILKKNGKLILTTPNPSSLRSRFSQFVGESEHYNSPLPNEHNAFTIWGNPSLNEGYFSKLFISGVLRLRTLAALQNLNIEQIVKTNGSSTSRLLLIFYPFIYYFSRKTFKKHVKEMPQFKNSFQEIFNINTSKSILLSNHLILIFVKK
jgi:SAM-dependent methyltransferase